MADWNGNQMYLFSEHKYFLTIRSDGTVLGKECPPDLDCRLEVSSAGGVSLVRIRGLKSNRYLCFNPDGKLYGEEDSSVEATVFVENFARPTSTSPYSTFRSKIYPEWYVGITKSGAAKNGHKTAMGQKAVKFLPSERKD